jgi:hypothetical protein
MSRAVEEAFGWGFGLVAGASTAAGIIALGGSVGVALSDVVIRLWSTTPELFYMQNTSCVIEIFGTIDDKMLRKIQLQLKNNEHDSIDLIIDSGGGRVYPTMAIISLLQNFEGKVRTWVPYRALSGATLLALCMLSKGPVTVSSLAVFSPVDPLQSATNDDTRNRTLTAYRNQMALLEDCKSNQNIIDNHDVAIAAQLKVVAQDIEQLLLTHPLSLVTDENNKSQLLKTLLTGEIAHESQVITPKLIQSLGLPIIIQNQYKFPPHIFDLVKL